MSPAVPETAATRRLARRLSAQAAYFIASGLWPWIHYRSFEAVTGAKTDDWLVLTVGLLLAVIGAVLLAGARRPAAHGIAAALALGSAAAMAVADIGFALNGTVDAIYLVDGAVQCLWIVLIGTAAWRAARSGSHDN
jgi:hypothetical protein